MRHRVFPADACRDDVTFKDLLLPSHRERLAGYEQKFPGMLYDLEQDPFKRPRVHRMQLGDDCSNAGTLGSLVSHGTLYNSVLERPMAWSEWLRAHCFLPEPTVDFPQPVNFIEMLKQGHLTPSDIRSLVGNSWHLGIFGAYIMWTLAHLEQVTVANPRAIVYSVCDSDEDDDTGAASAGSAGATVSQDETGIIFGPGGCSEVALRTLMFS